MPSSAATPKALQEGYSLQARVNDGGGPCGPSPPPLTTGAGSSSLSEEQPGSTSSPAARAASGRETRGTRMGKRP